uniref:RING-CH-type domain-containing protein n=1 Tax=Chromera velia CCMP2878 TaxID=1169474 RepID=A0A0G4IEI9_9ALVE|eukprot:Cvel_13712.t1-p1 / transcript=Cvel_13712.t1 / gene=Cvel_13712 / organism=Chromera_velia_CCMP2878 / gene_product=E3 ubiquitin-protein ligase MARCH2, putative / transcript_product=E3 ubiquitin-protein ligase MARCH2, putative / location=Cvel_scaffold948:13332-14453(+) / protein_length=374 / sequence_SO=supercontig / SO=protein_coding / is_pseudo=false
MPPTSEGDGDATRRSESEEDAPLCRICGDGEDFPELDELFHPCKCTGSLHFVHRVCLERWRREQNAGRRVRCEICGHRYEMIRKRAPVGDVLFAYSRLFVWGLFLLAFFFYNQWAIGRMFERTGREFYGWDILYDKDVRFGPIQFPLLPHPVDPSGRTVFRTFLGGLSDTGVCVVLLVGLYGTLILSFCCLAPFVVLPCALWDEIVIRCERGQWVTGGRRAVRRLWRWLRRIRFYRVARAVILGLSVGALGIVGFYFLEHSGGGKESGPSGAELGSGVDTGHVSNRAAYAARFRMRLMKADTTFMALCGDLMFVLFTVVVPFGEGVFRVRKFLFRGYSIKDLDGQVKGKREVRRQHKRGVAPGRDGLTQPLISP